MTTVTADQVVADTVEAAQAVFGAEIEAIYTLGSLAHGGFAPLVSDIDVAIVLSETAPRPRLAISAVQKLVVEQGEQPARRIVCRSSGPTGGRSEPGRASTSAWARSTASTSWICGACSRARICESRACAPQHEDLVLMSADLMLGKFTAGYLEGLRDHCGARGQRATSADQGGPLPGPFHVHARDRRHRAERRLGSLVRR